MNTETVPDIPVGPPGYCGSVADELRRIAAALDTVGHLELPEPAGATFWLQPLGTDDQVIAAVDALGKAVLGTPGEPCEMSGGTYHYKAYGQLGPLDVRFFRRIALATAESVKAASEVAAREAELAKLRARVAELEAQQVGLDYSRDLGEADDPTPVSPARGGQPHVVAVTDGGLVDETPGEVTTLGAAICYSEARRGALRVLRAEGRPLSELNGEALNLLHKQALAEDTEYARRADARPGEQGRVTNPNMARFLAGKEEKRRTARRFLGLEESAKHYPAAEPADCEHPWHSTTLPTGEPDGETCPECGDHAFATGVY